MFQGEISEYLMMAARFSGGGRQSFQGKSQSILCVAHSVAYVVIIDEQAPFTNTLV
jgi:hypothetical protein